MAVKTYQKAASVQLSDHINSREMRCGLGRPCSCATTLIDTKLVEILERSRVHFGKPLTITSGYRCPGYNKSTAGRVVKLLQPYDSTIFTGEPEELPAQWGFQWSQDPAHARPFVAISTSPYNKGDCCTEDRTVYRSTMDGNVWAPSAYPQGWEAVEL